MDSVLLIKVVSKLLYPLGLVLVLLLLALVLRGTGRQRLARLCVFFGLSLFLLASNPLVATKLLQSLESQYPQQALADIPPRDAILVLGGGLRLPIAPARQVQLSGGSDRYWHARQLFLAGKAPLIVLAGGNVFAQPGIESEAFYARQLLMQWGVPAEAIVIETRSRTTEQNANNIASLLAQQGFDSIILVTSAYHMPRALMHFSRLPVEITPASADVLLRDTQRPAVLNWLPSIEALTLTTVALHEYYGMAFARLKALMASG